MFRLLRTPSKDAAEAASTPSSTPAIGKSASRDQRDQESAINALNSDSQSSQRDDAEGSAKPAKKEGFRIGGLKINALRSVAKRLGISGKGKKQELVDKIQGAEGAAAVIAEIEAEHPQLLHDEGDSATEVSSAAGSPGQRASRISDGASSIQSYGSTAHGSPSRNLEEGRFSGGGHAPAAVSSPGKDGSIEHHNHRGRPSGGSPNGSHIPSVVESHIPHHSPVRDAGAHTVRPASPSPGHAAESVPPAQTASDKEVTPKKGSFSRTIASAMEIIRSASLSPPRRASPVKALMAAPSPVPVQVAAVAPPVVAVVEPDDSAIPPQDLSTKQLKRRLDKLKARFDAIAPPAIKEYMVLSNIPVRWQDAPAGAEDSLLDCPAASVVLSVKKDGTITIEKRVARAPEPAPMLPSPHSAAVAPVTPVAGNVAKKTSRPLPRAVSSASSPASLADPRASSSVAKSTMKQPPVSRSISLNNTGTMPHATPATAVKRAPVNRVPQTELTGEKTFTSISSNVRPTSNPAAGSSRPISSVPIATVATARPAARTIRATPSTETAPPSSAGSGTMRSPQVTKTTAAATKRATDTARAQQQISAAQALTAAASAGNFASAPASAPVPPSMQSPPPVSSAFLPGGSRGSGLVEKKDSPPVVQPFLQLTAADRTEERKRMERLVGPTTAAKGTRSPTELMRNMTLSSSGGGYRPSGGTVALPRDRASSPHRMQSSDLKPLSSASSSGRPGTAAGTSTPTHKGIGTPTAHRVSTSAATASNSATKRASSQLTSPVGRIGAADAAKRSTPVRPGASTLLSTEKAAQAHKETANAAAPTRSSLQSAAGAPRSVSRTSNGSNGSSIAGAKKAPSSTASNGKPSPERGINRTSTSARQQPPAPSSQPSRGKEVKISPKREAANPFSAIC